MAPTMFNYQCLYRFFFLKLSWYRCYQILNLNFIKLKLDLLVHISIRFVASDNGSAGNTCATQLLLLLVLYPSHNSIINLNVYK